MFRKLRTKMILLNIAVVALVMVTIIFLISFSSVSILRRQAENMKARIEETGLSIWQRSDSPDNTPILGNKVIVVPVDEQGEMTTVYDFQRFPEEGLRQTLFELIDENFPDMRYIKNDEREFFTFNLKYEDKTFYFFIDATQERELNRQIIQNTLFIGAGAIVLIILASMFLTKRALLPIKDAWNKQKKFISDASHELRTPVAVIKTNMEVIQGDEESTVKEQKNWMDNINFEIGRMTGLIDNLLFLSKMDKSNSEKYTMIGDLGTIIERVSLNIQKLAEEKGLTIFKELKTTSVNVPETDIERLAVILMENAVKYTEKGKITVKTYIEDNNCILSVEDTGKGIDEKEQVKIFERFYRADQDRSRKTGGYGLGLAIAKSIVDNYKGKIEVKSKPGEGSEFRVYLPKAKNQ